MAEPTHAPRVGKRRGLLHLRRSGRQERDLGNWPVFEDAGSQEVSHPTVRRVVMRIDFEQGDDVR
ncbi:MAG: hypothetical protein WKF73_10685 [Nocardioidaceae bacterium]